MALFCDGFGVLRSRWAFCGQVFCSSFLVVGGYELLLSYFSYLTRTLDLHFRSNFHSPPLYHTKNLDDRFFFLTKPLGVNWTCRAWRVPLPHFARWVRRWKTLQHRQHRSHAPKYTLNHTPLTYTYTRSIQIIIQKLRWFSNNNYKYSKIIINFFL